MNEPRKPETVPEQLRRIATLLPSDSREWAQLHRISGYVEALERDIDRAKRALGGTR